jgi:hypothetical protein
VNKIDAQTVLAEPQVSKRIGRGEHSPNREFNQMVKICFANLLSEFQDLKAAASYCRAQPSLLSDYANLNKKTMPPIDVIHDLEVTCGTCHVTFNYQEITSKKWSAKDACPVRSTAELATLQGKFAEQVLSAVCPNSPGGPKITPNEERDIGRAGQDLINGVRTAAGATKS